jgi:surfactin family lipopeptide synthetase C
MDNVADIYRLTPAQSGILYHVLRDNDPELYFEQYRADTSGPLDPDRFAAAWQMIVDRHPALRTIIVWQGLDEPRQVVRQQVDLAVVRLDLSGEPADAHAATLDELAATDRALGIDLTKAPLMRITLVKLGPDRWHFIWSFHHIVVDGWSVGIIIDELLTVLDQPVLDQPVLDQPALGEPAPPFRRHVAWLAQQPDDLSLWAQRFGDMREVSAVDLPGGRGVGRFDRRRLDLDLTPEQSELIVNAARDQRITPNTLVQAAWALTLGRYVDTDDVVFGVTMSGRPHEVDGVDDMVGMFLSTLPMRTTVPSESSVREWCRDLQNQQFDLLAHQHVSLAEVQRVSGLPAGVEMFDSVLIFENWPERTGHHLVELHNRHVAEQSHYPLTLMVGVRSTVDVVLLYDADRFGAGSVEQLARHFVAALVGIAADPDSVPAAIDVLDAREADQQLNQWNSTDVVEPDTTVVDEWSAILAADPDAVALIADGDVTTRSQLDERARSVAAGLIELGVEVGEPVGICMRRSPESIAALLGIVMAGAAYVPLDPTYPSDRLDLMVRDSGARVVIGHDATMGRLDHPGMVNAAGLCAHGNSAHGNSAHENSAPDLEQRWGSLDPDAVLYLTYTSGSTGVPKGVAGHHRGVLSRCRWQWNAYPFAAGERVLQKVTLNFVDHLWELWGGLLAGAPLVLVDEDTASDGLALVDLADTHGIRRLVLTPSFVEALLDSIPNLAERLASLDTLTLSGEGVSLELIDRLAAELPHVVPLNFYGMSEVTLDATTYDARDRVEASSFPIGKPIANQRVYVLDRHLRLLPAGAVGNIYVSGIGLTHGYWKRPDLTEARFVDHPFRPGERLYFTGDLGRWLPGGYIEYHGRSDDQVKIRGSRLELGDVEATLSTVPGVASCVAAAVEGTLAADRRLVAFVKPATGRDDVDVLVDQVRRAAREQLPAFMVPSVVIAIDAVPTLPNGKTDRRALVEVFHSSFTTADAGVELAPPSSADEATMIGLWSGVLGVDIGATSDFFYSGGHSLGALRLVARISKAFGTSVVLPDLLDHPTPRELLAHIRRPDRTAARAHLVDMAGAGQPGVAVYCVHGAGGNVLRFAGLAKRIARNRPFIALQAQGADGTTRPHSTVEEMADAYVAELMAYQPDGPLVLAGYSAGGAVAYEMARVLAERGRDVRAVALIDTYHPTLRPRRRSKTRAVVDTLKLGPAGAVERLRSHRSWTASRAAWKEQRDDAGEVVADELRFARLTEAIRGAYRAYVPVPIGVPLVVISAEREDNDFGDVGADRGWGEVSDQVTVVRVPGDHHNLLTGDMADVTADAIEEAIGLFV